MTTRHTKARGTTARARTARPTAVARARRKLTAEGGFTLVELLVALFVLAIGIVTTINVFTSSKHASQVAQRHEVAVHQAQREMERLRELPYRDQALSAAPQTSDRLESDPTKIGYFSGTRFVVKSAAGGNPQASEDLVVAPGGEDPRPERFTVGGSGLSGEVYSYVTWRNDPDCPEDVCPGTQDTKRLIVAVTVYSNNRPGFARPVWMASVAFDPNSEPVQ